MPNLSGVDLGNLYCMFKGEPGVRKSTQALSFPTPQYWLSWDRKMGALAIPARAWGINFADIEYDDYDDWSKARKKLEDLQIRCKYKTIVADSITTCGDSALRQTMAMKKGQTRSSGSTAGKLIAGIAVNELEDFMAESSALMELISLTKDISSYHHVSIILIAHVIQAEYKSPSGQTHMSRTIVTAGKRVAPKIPAYCTEVYHFNIEKGFAEDSRGSYALFTQHTGDDFARTSLPLEPKIIFNEEPLYPGWIAPAIIKLKGDTNVTTPPPPPPSIANFRGE